MDNIVVQRPEFVREVETSAYGVVEKPLTTGEKVFNNAAVRKGILLVLLAVIWQVYATMLANPLLFPKFSETFAAFYENIMNGVLLQRGCLRTDVDVQLVVTVAPGIAGGDCDIVILVGGGVGERERVTAAVRQVRAARDKRGNERDNRPRREAKPAVQRVPFLTSIRAPA